MSLKRVVVTGLGALTPIGNDINSFWKGLVSGKSGADFITYFDSSKFKTQFACELKGYDPLNYFDRKEARKLDRFAQYAIVCSDEAIKDSGLQLEKIDKSRITKYVSCFQYYIDFQLEFAIFHYNLFRCFDYRDSCQRRKSFSEKIATLGYRNLLRHGSCVYY